MKKYKEIKYLIKQNPRMYFWLAYIRLPDGHKWARKRSYDNIPLNVHGGLTFMCKITGKEKGDDIPWQGFTEGTWIGWDYGHAGDFVDYGLHDRGSLLDDDKKWDYEEVEEEVKNAINDLTLRISEI